jgi:hypothetical protein
LLKGFGIMLGCSYELNTRVLNLSDARDWLEEYLPPGRWKLFQHPYEDAYMVLWFRFEADALLFGLAHSRAPKRGARVFLSILSRIAIMLAVALLLIWMFLWVKLGYKMVSQFASEGWYKEPNLEDFLDQRIDAIQPLVEKFEDWHHKAIGGEP